MDFDIEYVLEHATNAQKIALVSGSDFWHTTALPDFNVPSIRFSDGPNGIRGTRFFGGAPATCIPCGTALGSTWDKELMFQAGELLARDCITKGVHCWLGPTINNLRSPAGGRSFESYSEDPHLSGILAAAIIQGCESLGILATPKHFVCNDQEHERRAVDTIVTERALREVYLRPFQIVARDASPACLMTAYNKINGSHVSQSERFLKHILRDEWKWNPLTVSDWYGTYSTSQALKAGLDLEMPGPSRYRGSLADFALSSRLVSQGEIDARVRNVLKTVKRASKLSVSKVEGHLDTPEDRALNREICAKSIVLLKNEAKVLPIPRSMKVALIGSHVKTPALYGGGSASLKPSYYTTLFDAISQKLSGSDSKITYAIGAYAHKILPVIHSLKMLDGIQPGASMRVFNEDISVTSRKCIAETVIQETEFQLMDYNPPGLRRELFYAQVDAFFVPDTTGPWTFGLVVCGTGNLFLDDKLIIDNSTAQQSGTAFFGKGTREEKATVYLEAGRQYKLRLDWGSMSTSKLKHVGVVSFGGGGARLGACLEIDPETAVQQAVAVAEAADYVVLCTGLNSDFESEGYDRDDINLPPGIDHLISSVLAANPMTVVVTQSGTPFSMPWISQAQTLLHAWYGGNETGNGIADVLFGDVNPSGKLSMTWPERLEDTPSFLNFGATKGRVLYGEDIYVGYKYYDIMKRGVLFPFGHGLSYTEFKILKATTTCAAVTVEIANTGEYDGSVVLQVYISAIGSSIKRPVKELHGFDKITLMAGVTKEVQVAIDAYAGSFWDESESRWVAEAGEYQVLVGTSSTNFVSAGSFHIKRTHTWLGL